MHERTRRAVARMLFAFTCALPTLITCWLILLTWTPWYGDYRRRQLEQELSTRLGISVSIQQMEYPTPTAMRLVGVQLHDPESQVEIARIRSVTWATGNDQRVLYFSQPELRSAQLPQLWQAIHQRFLCQPDLTTSPLRMIAKDLTIRSETGPLTLEKIDAGLTPHDQRVIAWLQCTPAASKDNKQFVVEVTRDRSGAMASTDWQLRSPDLPLPCSPLAECLPIVRNLGTQATFTGQLRWTISHNQSRSQNHWSLDLSGSRLDRVDLSELTHSVPHRLSGTASIQLERGLIVPGESVDLSGTLVAAQGLIGQSLLQAARNELRFAIAAGFDELPGDLPYERIGLRFDWFGPQLALAGIAGKLRGYEFLDDGVVVTAGGLAVARSSGEPHSWASLVRAFWQDGRETLPVSGQSAWLLGVLPAPQRIATAATADTAGGAAPPPPRFTGTVTAGTRIAQDDRSAPYADVIVQPDG